MRIDQQIPIMESITLGTLTPIPPSLSSRRCRRCQCYCTKARRLDTLTQFAFFLLVLIKPAVT